MLHKYTRNISATGIQIIANQLLGLGFFLLLSSSLSKDLFGELNWSVALSTTFFIILSFGLDNILVRGISAGWDIQHNAGSYFFHAVVLGLSALGLLSLHWIFYPSFHSLHDLLFAIFTGYFFTFAAAPFKQIANGRERFGYLAAMNVSGNFFRLGGLVIILGSHTLSVNTLSRMFLVSGILEFLVCFGYGWKITGQPLRLRLNRPAYKAMLRQSLPQFGAILLDSSFGRIDWILMGVLSTKAFVADYSFAYKAFESSRIPLLIIATILLPKMSRILGTGKTLSANQVGELHTLWRLERITWVFIPLVLNVCWVDIVNGLTHHQYGESTRLVYALLSFVLPMAYISNFMWTIIFAKGQIHLVFRISLVVTLSNILLNVLLIPWLHANGAAIAFLISSLIQMLLYLHYGREPLLRLPVAGFFGLGLLGAGIVFVVNLSGWHWLIRVPAALVAFLVLAKLTGSLQFLKDLSLIKSVSPSDALHENETA